jgi:hypothetical protein
MSDEVSKVSYWDSPSLSGIEIESKNFLVIFVFALEFQNFCGRRTQSSLEG